MSTRCPNIDIICYYMKRLEGHGRVGDARPSGRQRDRLSDDIGIRFALELPWLRNHHIRSLPIR